MLQLLAGKDAKQSAYTRRRLLGYSEDKAAILGFSYVNPECLFQMGKLPQNSFSFRISL